MILDDHQRAHPEAAGWRLLAPPRDHPAILAWLEQRLLRLWQEKRARQASRIASARNETPPAQAGVWSGTDWVPVGEATIRPRAGCVARARDSAALAEILARVLPPSEQYLVKVTWHGYAPGTYTGPPALDLLLGALPGRAVLLEGHTSSRNLGGADIDWETDARAAPDLGPAAGRRIPAADGVGGGDRPARGPVPERDRGVVGRRRCAGRGRPGRARGRRRSRIRSWPVSCPRPCWSFAGRPLISFARFKGPTRLGISNLFGLIPHPLRSAWHGPDITHFASVCCDLARLYGCLLSPVRSRGGASTRPCAGTARGCTGAAGGITTWCSPTGSSR